MENKKMKFAIYSRKSRWTNKGDSVENQIQMCKDYLDINFTDIDKSIYIYEDEGFSGKNLNRPKFQEMMKDCEYIKFDYIVVYRLDRISRNVGDFANLTEQLNKYGCSFICIKEQFDTSTPMGRAMMNIAMVFAQLERETISERIRDNILMMSKTGKWTGGNNPFGYRQIRKEYIDENGKTKTYCTLETDEQTIRIVKLIFEKYQEFRSYNKVTVYLNANKIYTPLGKPWHKSSIRRILNNPLYCIADKESYDYYISLGCEVCFSPDIQNNYGYGLISYNKRREGKLKDTNTWIIAVSEHQGLITGKEWVYIQNLMKENLANSFLADKYLFGSNEEKISHNKITIIGSLLKCKQCGKHMYPKKCGSGYYYYICHTKSFTRGEICGNAKNIRVSVADEKILETIFDYNVTGNIINEQIEKAKKKLQDIKIENNNEEIVLNQLKEENLKKISNLINVVSMNVSSETIQAVNQQITKLTEDNKRIDEQIKKSNGGKNELKVSKENIDNVCNNLEFLKKNFDSLSFDNKRNCIREIIEKITWDGENLEIFIKGC